ncbi:hypothetical protein JCM16303_005747 [Sporobolomyces ruberrimus]
MRTTTFTSVAATALFATSSLVSGQSLGSSLGGISSDCQQAALTLLGSDFATCSNLQGLLGIVTGASGNLIDPINTWLGGLCTKGNCSTSAIQNATSVVDTGCSSDIQDGNELVTTLRSAITNFNDEKAAVCLRSTANNQYCITSLLSEIQNATNTDISITSIATLNISAFQQLQPATVCTDCNSALLHEFSRTGALNQSEIEEARGFCSNSDFGSKIPDTVSAVSTNSSSSSTGGSSNGTSNGGSANGSSTGGTNAAGSLTLGGLAQVAVAGVAGIVGIALLA